MSQPISHELAHYGLN